MSLSASKGGSLSKFMRSLLTRPAEVFLRVFRNAIVDGAKSHCARRKICECLTWDVGEADTVPRRRRAVEVPCERKCLM